MPAITNKQRQLTQLLTLLKKEPETPDAEPRLVLEQFIYGLLRENATSDLADQALRSLRERFFDWNEIRVSSVPELEEALCDLPEPEARAERLISFLQEVFEADFAFDLESLQKKGLKESAKKLAEYQAANEYVVAWVIQRSLAGHAIPLDLPTLRASRRLGLIDCEADDLEAARSSLEHLVPKARGAEFSDVISNLAAELCWEEEPRCSACPMARECPTGQEILSREGVGAGRASRPKPR